MLLPWFARLLPLACVLALTGPAAAAAAPDADAWVVAAREALGKKDATQLSAALAAVSAVSHPLAQWVAYWELQNRLATAQQPELEAFYARWPGTYVEDRLRDDWLLELGRRRDWANLRIEYPRFRMNDDREVSCYALLAQHLQGQDVREPALAAWYAQRELDDGCAQLASTLAQAKLISADDIWHEVRLSVENHRLAAARAASALISPAAQRGVTEALENPARFLSRRARLRSQAAADRPLEVVALMRLAINDPDAAVDALNDGWSQRLPVALAATAWAHAAKQAAFKRLPHAADHARRAWQLWQAAPRVAAGGPGWSDELLAWHVRAALRQPPGERSRWQLMQQAIAAMSPAQQRDAAWVYWQARATLALARRGDAGEAARSEARQALQGIASPLHFYGLLAAEELGQRSALPPAAAALSAAERDAARARGGLARALQLVALGLRNEGVREWNYTLRGLSDRELLAAAQLACEHEVWDRCVNTSERTRAEVDLSQRYPMPLREPIAAQARAAGLEPALLLGLIRQESRFINATRSVAGAGGLMQLMPGTASWTARQLGLAYRRAMIDDPVTNVQLGATYLRKLVDEFEGSLPMATAAYNAGPGRPRRWREGALMEPAAWAETIPFNETRDYVKKVLSNAVIYTALLGQDLPTLKSVLGTPIGPRSAAAAAAPEKDLP